MKRVRTTLLFHDYSQSQKRRTFFCSMFLRFYNIKKARHFWACVPYLFLCNVDCRDICIQYITVDNNKYVLLGYNQLARIMRADGRYIGTRQDRSESWRVIMLRMYEIKELNRTYVLCAVGSIVQINITTRN